MKVIIKNLYKIIDSQTILHNINLELKDTHIYGIVGDLNSGKSMLLKTICGFITPNCGFVEIMGEKIYESHLFPSKTAVYLENPTFFPTLSGIDNLRKIAFINKIADKDINHALEIVDLEEKKELLVKNYTNLMKQKLGIAAVLMENAQLMIFDEPYFEMDDKGIRKLNSFLQTEKTKHKIILISSQNIEELKTICDEIFLMENGKIMKKEVDFL